MARTDYAPRAEYIGTGLLDTYTFDFKIKSLEHLIVGVVDTSNETTFRVRGDDTTYLDSVTFSDSGGEVVLASVLPSNHKLYILLADDAPLQESQFKDKGSFKLEQFEAALDVLSGQVQRLAYLAKRSLKIGDQMVQSEADDFDTQIPFNSTNDAVQDNTDKVVCVGSDNKSFKMGPSVVTLAQEAADAQAAAAAAATSESNAATSAAASQASADDAAQSALDAEANANQRAVFNGVGVPDPAIGGNGSFYIDTATWDLYGPKAGGVWGGVATTLVGPQGDTGPSGADGLFSSIAAVGSSPNANGVSNVAGAFTLQPADGTNPGVLTAGTQTIGGNKTFSGWIKSLIYGNLRSEDKYDGTDSSQVLIASGYAAAANSGDAFISSGNADVNTGDAYLQSGTSIGGSNGNSGDVIVRSGLPTGSGTRGEISLTARRINVNSTPIVNVPAPSNGNDAVNKTYADGKVGSVANMGAVPNSAGASVSAGVLTMQPADSTNPGLLSAGAQAIGGIKSFTDLIRRCAVNGLTAFAGGGQASATALTKNINRVTTVATAADSVKLPQAFAGDEVIVINRGANDMNVYPYVGDNINTLAANAAYSIVAGNNVRFICAVNGTWDTASGGGGGDIYANTLQTLANAAAITLAAQIRQKIRIKSTGGEVTCTLPNGTLVNQELFVQGTDSDNPVIIQNASNVVSNGDIIYYNGTLRHYIWDTTDSKWYQVGA